jgi:UDP-glucose 4-epimerase
VKVLVTGGAGYIGSHTCLELLGAGHEVMVVDNLCNSKEESLRRVQKLTGKQLEFSKLDVRDRGSLAEVFGQFQPEAVIHFAGLKAVGESVKEPLRYFDTNLISTIYLLEVMQEYNVRQLIFSSSATVYGEPDHVPIAEDAPLQVTNPYGRTKLMIEDMLRDVFAANSDWRITLLRYFNPVGAHPSGQIGEDPAGIPNNLFPFVSQVAVGRLPRLSVYGKDYPTPDGTCVRDYLHVVDLAKGHVKALDHGVKTEGLHTYNLGTGKGKSVLEVVQAFVRATGREIPYVIADRRPGDSAATYADASKAERELDWKAEKTLDDMCADSWRWQSSYPKGYDE